MAAEHPPRRGLTGGDYAASSLMLRLKTLNAVRLLRLRQ